MTEVENSTRLDALKSDKKFINKCLLHYFWGTGAWQDCLAVWA